VLLVVDDLPWLDRPSAMVLGLVARRLTGTRIGFLGAARPEEDRFFERRTLPGHEVRPLDQAAAGELIRACFPELAPQVRRRLLAEALGNPLALVELPAALTGPQRAGLAALPAVLPLHGRLQSLFASRVTSLPDPARRLLLLAALDGSGELRVLSATGKSWAGDLAPAEQAGWCASMTAPGGWCSATRLSGPPRWSSRRPAIAVRPTGCWPDSGLMSPSGAPGTWAERRR
jgi:hypothetical protein